MDYVEGVAVYFIDVDGTLIDAGDVVVDDSLEFKVPEGAFLKTPDEFTEWVFDA